MPNKFCPLRPMDPSQVDAKVESQNIYYLNIDSNVFLSKYLFRNRLKNKLGILLTDLILDVSGKDFDDSVPFTICKLTLAS